MKRDFRITVYSVPGPSNITPGGDEPPPTPSSSSNEEQQLKEWNWGSGDQSSNIKNYYIFLMNMNVKKAFFRYPIFFVVIE